MAMLEVKDLEVYYGMIQAIKGISFEVNQGEVIALIGANGAGKTTTLHTITGLLSPKKGSVVFEGTDITKIPAHNAKKALSIADRAYVLETGKITMSGNAKDLLEDEAVKKAYLGE